MPNLVSQEMFCLHLNVDLVPNLKKLHTQNMSNYILMNISKR